MKGLVDSHSLTHLTTNVDNYEKIENFETLRMENDNLYIN